MKICDVVLNSVWFDPRVRKQIAEYSRQGIEIVVIGQKCSRYEPQKISQIPCKATIVCIDQRYDGFQKGILRKLWREKLRMNGVREAILAESPDIIHANDLDALIAAYPVYKKLKCKLIYDSHEICIENVYARRRYRFMLPLVKWYECYMIKHLNQMVCVSNAAADYFAKEYHIQRPMVITNCSLQSESVTDGIIKNEGFEVLNHGQFYAGRGYDIMVEAAHLLKNYPDIKLVLRGFGSMEEQLRQRVKNLDAKNVVFYPKVRVEELIPMAARSMVGLAITEPICLNFELSVSNKLFEYASAGLPVIMSDVPEHRYINEKYQIGIILEQNTPEKLVNAIVRFYSDKTFYETCQKNVMKMSTEINWENEFGRLIEMEREMVNE